MPKLDILGGTCEGRSPAVNASRTVNLYPELDADADSKAIISLVKTPGTSLWAAVGGTVNRGMHPFAGKLYVVVGNKLYSIATNGTVSASLGTLLTSTGRVSMADNGLLSSGIGGNQLAIMDGTAGYIYDVVKNEFHQITSYEAVRAELTLTLSPASIESVVLTSQGEGYTSIPVATVDDPTGSGAYLTVLYGFALDLLAHLGVVNFADWTSTGISAEYYLPSGTTEIVIQDVTGTGAKADPIIRTDGVTGNKYLTGIQMTDGGKAYTEGPTTGSPPLVYSSARIMAPGAAGFPADGIPNLIPVNNGSVTVLGVAVADGGSGYTDPTVVFSLGGSAVQATAVAIISLSIESVNVTTPGSGYIYLPTITIEGESFSQFTPAPLNIHGTGPAVTVTFRNHGFKTGNVVTVSGCSIPQYNKAAATVTVVDDNTFSYPAEGAIGTPDTPPTFTYPGFGTTTATATLSDTGIESVSFEGGTGYSIKPTVTVSEPQGTSFPDNPTTVTYFDGYFIVTNGTMSAFASELFNGLLFNPLATSPIQSAPDNVQTTISVFQQMLFIKQYTSEWFYDAAVPTSQGFPLARVGGGVITFGTRAPWSVCRGAGTVFWLADQWNGDAGEFIGPVMLSGSNPAPIGTPAINYRMGQWQDIENAFGYCYSDGGHTFVVWTSPGDNETLVYDVTTQMWHERSTYAGDDAAINRHIGNSYAYFNSKHLIGDWQSGNVYDMDSSHLTDAGQPIVWLRRTKHLFDNDRLDRLFVTRMEVDAEIEPKSSATVCLSCSKDNGQTFPVQHVKQASGRLVFHRLGMARDRVWQISGADPTTVVLLGGYAEVEK